MTILIAVLLVLGMGLGLLLGLLSVFQDLVEQYCQVEPVFHEPGPIFHDQDAEYRQVKSQFAWQSRSRFRAQD
jgi:hypothetical protein